MNRLKTQLGSLELQSPLMTASGTFGQDGSALQFLSQRELGAIVLKTVTPQPRHGNPPPRLFETPSGLLNSIGLENQGVEAFLNEVVPELGSEGIPIVANVGGESVVILGDDGDLVHDKRMAVPATTICAASRHLSSFVRQIPLLRLGADLGSARDWIARQVAFDFAAWPAGNSRLFANHVATSFHRTGQRTIQVHARSDPERNPDFNPDHHPNFLGRHLPHNLAGVQPKVDPDDPLT